MDVPSASREDLISEAVAAMGYWTPRPSPAPQRIFDPISVDVDEEDILPSIDTLSSTIHPIPSIRQDTSLQEPCGLENPMEQLQPDRRLTASPGNWKEADISSSRPPLDGMNGCKTLGTRPHADQIILVNGLGASPDDNENTHLAANGPAHETTASSDSSRFAVQGSFSGDGTEPLDHALGTPSSPLATQPEYEAPSVNDSSDSNSEYDTRMLELFDDSRQPGPWSHLSPGVSETHALYHQRTFHHIHNAIPTLPTEQGPPYYPSRL